MKNDSVNKIIIAVIGLGYVGLPIAIEFAKKYDVVGFDINNEKIEKYKKGRDITGEIGDTELSNSTCFFTSEEKDLKECNFFIVAVPTPINMDKTPNLNPVEDASKIVGKYLKIGDYVVYESTVYPGTTEEICIPILEEQSKLELNLDYKVGYSPERINPGDKVNTLTNIIKVVSGSDNEALECISNVYSSIIDAGVHKAESIKVAEACKVIENSQRDINIAFMNELAIVFNKMEIDTKAVLEAARSKWNFLDFKPGLVGGHCIGVDPYYFTYKAELLGYHSQIVLAGRKINDSMGKYIAENVIKELINNECLIKKAKIVIMGFTFKEDCEDVRNTKVVDIYNELKEYGAKVQVYDPIANIDEVKKEYGIDIISKESLKEIDCMIFAVGHQQFKEYRQDDINSCYKNATCKLMFDIKHIYNKKEIESKDIKYWRL